MVSKKVKQSLKEIDENLGIKEEIYGLNSIFIDGNLEKIKTKLKK